MSEKESASLQFSSAYSQISRLTIQVLSPKQLLNVSSLHWRSELVSDSVADLGPFARLLSL